VSEQKTSNFMDGKQRIATEAECKAKWSGRTGGFRCHLCGHRFKVGDPWRFVFGKSVRNFFTCAACDGPDVLDRFKAACDEAKRRFWWLFDDLQSANEEVSHESRVSYEAGKDDGFREGLQEGRGSVSQSW